MTESTKNRYTGILAAGLCLVAPERGIRWTACCHDLVRYFAMNSYWVTSSGLEQILSENSQTYISTSDRGKEKARSAYLHDVEGKLRAHALKHNEHLPDDLQAVCNHIFIVKNIY